MRSRFTFRDGDDLFLARGFSPPLLRGVVYAGAGDDGVLGGDRVYGGPGKDQVDGTVVHGGAGDDEVAGLKVGGGPGDDEVDAVEQVGVRTILRGGPGNDRFTGLGWLYGGPGDDLLELGKFPSDLDPPSMAVGGRGNDRVILYIGRRTVVRVRGGGADSVDCRLVSPTSSVVLFVDRSDRIDPACKTARITFRERPRAPR